MVKASEIRLGGEYFTAHPSTESSYRITALSRKDGITRFTTSEGNSYSYRDSATVPDMVAVEDDAGKEIFQWRKEYYLGFIRKNISSILTSLQGMKNGRMEERYLSDRHLPVIEGLLRQVKAKVG